MSSNDNATPRFSFVSRSILDPDTMRLSFGQDSGFMRDTMRIYMRDAPVLAEKALSAIRDGNNEQLTANAHALKGITAYFTRGEFYQNCLALEMLGREEGLPLQSVHALGLWAGINNSLQDMLDAMQNFIASS